MVHIDQTIYNSVSFPLPLNLTISIKRKKPVLLAILSILIFADFIPFFIHSVLITRFFLSFQTIEAIEGKKNEKIWAKNTYVHIYTFLYVNMYIATLTSQ